MLFLQYVVMKRPLNEINCLKLNCHGNVSWKTWKRLLTTLQSHSQDHPRLHSENDFWRAASYYHRWTCQTAMHAHIRLIWPFWPKLKNDPFWLKCKDILNLQLLQVQPDLTKRSNHFCHICDVYMKIPTDMPLQYYNAFFDKNALSILIIKISLSSILNIFLVQYFLILLWKLFNSKDPSYIPIPPLSYDHFFKRFLCQLFISPFGYQWLMHNLFCHNSTTKVVSWFKPRSFKRK